MRYECEAFENLNLDQDCLEDIFFEDCTFYRCRIWETTIRHCSFRGCSFKDCVIQNNTYEFTDLIDCRFCQCSLVGVNWNDVERENHIILPFSAFESCTLKHNLFFGFKLKQFDFSGCDLLGSTFQECDLRDSSFQRAGLKDTAFLKNDLTGADFRQAEDYAISLENNKMEKSRFSFPDAIRLLSSTGIIVE